MPTKTKTPVKKRRSNKPPPGAPVIVFTLRLMTDGSVVSEKNAMCVLTRECQIKWIGELEVVLGLIRIGVINQQVQAAHMADELMAAPIPDGKVH